MLTSREMMGPMLLVSHGGKKPLARRGCWVVYMDSLPQMWVGVGGSGVCFVRHVKKMIMTSKCGGTSPGRPISERQAEFSN